LSFDRKLCATMVVVVQAAGHLRLTLEKNIP
jgi:hypothetical protein